MFSLPPDNSGFSEKATKNESCPSTRCFSKSCQPSQLDISFPQHSTPPATCSTARSAAVSAIFSDIKRAGTLTVCATSSPSTRSSSITTSWPFVISSATPMSQQPRFTRKPQLPDSRPWSRPFPSHQDVGPVSRSCATSSLTNSSATHIRPRLPEFPAVPQTEGHHNEQDPHPLPGEVQMRTHRQTRPVQSSTLPSSAGGPIRLLRHKGREG